MIDKIAQALFIFKADTSDLKAKIKELQGEEKKLAQAQLDATQARNSQLEEWSRKLGKVTIALGVANEAIKFGAEAYQEYARHAQLSESMGAVSLSTLRQASRGLTTDMKLMELASAGVNGAWKMTESQIEAVVSSMRGFEVQGHSQSQVHAKLRDAILKGTVEPLKDLGLSLKSTGTQAGDFAEFMSAVADKSKLGGAATRIAGEDMRKAGVEWSNAVSDLKVKIGELVAGMAPLISALAKVLGLVVAVVDKAGGVVGGVIGSTSGLSGVASKARSLAAAQQAADATSAAASAAAEAAAAEAAQAARERFHEMMNRDEIEGWETRARLAFAPHTKNTPPSGAKKPRLGGEWSVLDHGGVDTQDRGLVGTYNGDEAWRTASGVAAELGGSGDDWWAGGGTLARDLREQTMAAAQLRGQREAGGMSADFGRAAESLQHLAGQLAESGQESLIARVLGPREEFEAYEIGLDTLGSAFGGLKEAAGAAFDAWITGSESAGKAFKRVLAEQMKALATSSAMNAMEQLAWGFAMSFKNPAEASNHFTSAAIFGAVAVGAGAIAKGAYSAGWASAGTSGGASSSAPSVRDSSRDHRIGRGGDGGSHVTVVIGDSFGDDSPRTRSATVARAYRRAQRELDDGGGVVYS